MFDYFYLWQNKLSLIPYACLVLAMLSLWIKRHIAVWGGLLLLGIITGLLTQRITPIALITIISLGILFFLSFRAKLLITRIITGLLGTALSVAIFFHLLPGFNNFEMIHQLKLTKDAVPYSPYFNFDKPLIGLFILGFGMAHINLRMCSKTTIYTTILMTIITLMVMIVLSLITHYVRFEPKWDNFFYIWALDNLIFVCVTEEALFRGIIQRSLSKTFASMRFGNMLAVVVASLLFGLVHIRGGVMYVLLSSIAGLLYGVTYLRTGRIEASISTHFIVNLVHITFFSYPALQPI